MEKSVTKNIQEKYEVSYFTFKQRIKCPSAAWMSSFIYISFIFYLLYFYRIVNIKRKIKIVQSA
jgi:hypothetical protein